MIEIAERELTYLWYNLSVQFRQIALYWALGIAIGLVVSVFGKDKIHSRLLALKSMRIGIFGIIPASLLGIASPLCMYGTIPIVASFSRKGVREDWLAAFMMSSMLINPQLLMYSEALGKRMLVFRFVFCFLGGICAGLCVRIFFKQKSFFSFAAFDESASRDTHSNMMVRLLFNMWRNVKATGPYFFLGIILTALYQRYIPQPWIANLFGEQRRGIGVLIAATLGVPLYVCGGGTIPLLAEWLRNGMSAGSAVAFMLSGPATKITNLSALKIVFSRHTERHSGAYEEIPAPLKASGIIPVDLGGGSEMDSSAEVNDVRERHGFLYGIYPNFSICCPRLSYTLLARDTAYGSLATFIQIASRVFPKFLRWAAKSGNALLKQSAVNV